MNAKLPLIIFPLLPFLAIFVSLFVKYAFAKDITSLTIVMNSILQLVTGLILITLFHNFEGMFTVILSEWKHSIILSFDSYRIYFMVAYLTPVLISLFQYRKLSDFNIRILFLFYLAGCSGLLVAGDIFNFYISYEVMIMAAYVLIAVNRKYYASIKYMIFGAASSAVFLAGIILLYASGSYFGYSFIFNLGDYNPTNVRFILLFFSIAFFIKAAFFPVSGWVATCHSATNSLISCFLASFTIFSGIMGMFYFVILPANSIGETTIISFIGILSLLTIMIPSLVLFFEPDLKRCIAGSTIFTVGFIGLLLAGGAYELGLLYLAIHAVYKSFMFLIYDQLVVDKSRVLGNILSLGVFGIAVLFTVGFFPTLTYFLKYNYLLEYQPFKVLVYISMFLVLGSFLKFNYKAEYIRINKGFYLVFPILLSIYYLLFPFNWHHSGFYLGIDFAVVILAVFFSKKIYYKASFLCCLDTKYLYININYELLYIIMLFIVQILVMRILS